MRREENDLGPGRLSTKAFRALLEERLLTTEQVRELLELKTTQAVRHRVRLGHLSGPVLVRDKGVALWDRVQVEREEAARVQAASK